MAKKSTKSTKTSKKTDTKASKGKKKAKCANERIMEKFQVADQPAAQPVIDASVAEAPPAEENAAPVATGGDPAAESTTTTTSPAGGDTGEPGATGGKRIGLVSAAIQILADAGANAAMNCHELVRLATERGLWQPRAGKTPANTLYAAILREIRDKGQASRFRKTERGKFSLNKTS
ncbi:MAG TPA: HTH domain-containing protein [Planctomycetota bacterium]|nr:HTH domain-containing protein [Planctomycetota bacterium]